uniref:Uncharacterized protein n=1 Tax=Anguilla anguilla TaxID=7936 RepID=A0A0E9X817_ANGAN
MMLFVKVLMSVQSEKHMTPPFKILLTSLRTLPHNAQTQMP